MMEYEVEQHFVEFLSPGSFTAESTTEPISAWDVREALKLMKGVKERYGAKPYGFRFFTKARKEGELDSSVVARSKMHYVGCRVKTLEQVKGEGPSVLLSNMEANGWEKVVTTTSGWAWTQPLHKGDVVL